MLTFLWLHLLLTANVFAAPVNEFDKTFELRILHNNDMHGRFLETSATSDLCSMDLYNTSNCYGGFARTAYLIKKYRSAAMTPGEKPVIYLNAGDTFTGTIWFSVFKDVITSELMNQLQPNATTFGNHEFDFGEKILTRYVKQTQFAHVVSNLDLTRSKFLSAAANLHESLILDIKGIKVGVVGYVTPDSMMQSSTGNILIKSEIDSINNQTLMLKEQHVDIIIALGHSGFEADKEIAAKCLDVDIIIGGHTNTFLYNGNAPDREIPEDVYPVVIKKPSNGKKTLVLHAYAYTKYLGVLDVKFDSCGDILEWTGNPVLVDAIVPQDKTVLNILERFRPNVTALSVVVGSTKTLINGNRTACRRGECTLGNLVADSLLYARHKDLIAALEPIDTFVALTSAGGIKSSLTNSNDGKISLLDVRTAFPYENILYTVNLRGDVLLRALEHSASLYMNSEDGGFLQFTGMKVVYDMANEVGHRVVSAEIRIAADAGNEQIHFEAIKSEKSYKVVMAKFLLKGGDAYEWGIGDNYLDKAAKMDWYDSEALLEFIKVKSPLMLVLEGRQTVLHTY